MPKENVAIAWRGGRGSPHSSIENFRFYPITCYLYPWWLVHKCLVCVVFGSFLHDYASWCIWLWVPCTSGFHIPPTRSVGLVECLPSFRLVGYDPQITCLYSIHAFTAQPRAHQPALLSLTDGASRYLRLAPRATHHNTVAEFVDAHLVWNQREIMVTHPKLLINSCCLPPNIEWHFTSFYYIYIYILLFLSFET